MIKAIESGTGSISTTHAADAVAAVRKLVTCAMEAGPHVTQGLATSKLAATVDLIVQLSMETTLVPGGARRTRRVAEIIALAPGEKDPGYATTHVFSSDAAGVAVPDVLPDEYRVLARYGFDLAGYLSGQTMGAMP
jgi:Flp pilus assembly CpaF family ATPase